VGVFYRDRKSFDDAVPGFIRALAERGWEAGRNLDLVWAGDDRRPDYLVKAAAELVAARPDAILTLGTAATRAAQVATNSIPIIAQVADPIQSGFAASLSRPGGNLTGLAFRPPEIDDKAIEILLRVVPRTSRLTVLYHRNFEASRSEVPAHVVSAARRAGLKPRIAYHATRDEMEAAVRESAREPDCAIFVGTASYQIGMDVASAAMANRVVTLTNDPGYARWSHKGFLIGFSMGYSDRAARWAALLDKVLRGESPATIPFEQPDQSELIVNRRIAAALGVDIPADILLRANSVVD
jgi:putative ABC transport system substrate-binding protein